MTARILVLALLACAAAPCAAAAQVDTVGIQVSALRAVWADTALTRGAPVRCLGEWTEETGTFPGDATPRLLARLADGDPPVVPLSACESEVRFLVDQPHRIQGRHARVLVNSRCGETCQWSAECMLELDDDGAWRTSACELRAVSTGEPEEDADEPDLRRAAPR